MTKENTFIEEILNKVGREFGENYLLRIEADNKIARQIVKNALTQCQEQTRKKRIEEIEATKTGHTKQHCYGEICICDCDEDRWNQSLQEVINNIK